MRAPLGRGRLAAVLVALSATVAVAPASGADRCGVPGQMVNQRDRWTRIAAPPFKTGGSTILGYDVGRQDEKHIVATNGTVISFTFDRGCTWHDSLMPPASDLPLPAVPVGEGGLVTASVTEVRATDYGVKWAIGMASVVSSGVPVTQPRVLWSVDGTEFEQRVTGLPTLGRPVRLHPVDAMNALLLFHQSAPQDQYAIYQTRDAGKNWAPVWANVPALEDFTIAGATVWGWDAAKLYRATALPAPTPFAAVNGIPGSVAAVDSSVDLATRRPLVSVFLRAGTERYVSTDGGTSFSARPAPEGVQSVARSADLSLVISSTEANVLVEPGPARPKGVLDYSPAEVNVSDVRVVRGSGFSFPVYAMSANALYRRIVDFVPPPPPPPPPPVDVKLREVKPVKRVPAITPAHPVISLKPDERKTVRFKVALPPQPTPLDVFFMTDSTGSMERTIGSVQSSVQDIVDDLSATGIDLHFGVADFRDWPEQPGDASTYPYNLRRIAGPVDAALADALESIRTGGGTTDGDDAALEAIYQATTGAGRVDPLLARGQMLKPGLDAKFRKDALKVVLVVSDDEMRAGFPNPTRPDYPGPTLDTVAKALVEHDVHMVGIRVGQSAALRKDMETLASRSGTLAPAGGVDCDGDDVPDVQATQPLVCDFQPGSDESIAPAFISLLAGIRDYAPVSVEVNDPDGVAESLSDTDYGKLDVKAPHTFTVPVEFRCDSPRYGKESEVDVKAVVRGENVVGTTAIVKCGAPVKPEVKQPIPAIEQLPPDLPHPAIKTVVAIAIAPAPPAQPVTNPNTNLNPNTNPNPNPNPNAGAATEQEQQSQLALAENDLPPQEDMAFSARSVPVPSTPVLAWLAALGITSAAAFGTQMSRRARPAPVFDPREYR